MPAIKSCSRYGFTLIEMLVVAIVLALLAAIVLPKFQDQSRRSKEAALKSDLAQLRSAIATFQADTGYYPKALSDLTVTSAAGVSGVYDSKGTAQTLLASDWHGPYLTGTIPNDPVSGSAFTYSVTIQATGQLNRNQPQILVAAGTQAGTTQTGSTQTTTSQTVGKVSSSATGNDLGGTAYSSY